MCVGGGSKNDGAKYTQTLALQIQHMTCDMSSSAASTRANRERRVLKGGGPGGTNRHPERRSGAGTHTHTLVAPGDEWRKVWGEGEGRWGGGG